MAQCRRRRWDSKAGQLGNWQTGSPMEKESGFVARIFSLTLERRGETREWVCRCSDAEMAPLSAAVRHRPAMDLAGPVGSGYDGTGLGATIGSNSQDEARDAGRGSQSWGLTAGKKRKRRLVADLERAARRRLNGAVGGERVPAHYQALLPLPGYWSRDVRLWRCPQRPHAMRRLRQRP